ncbi:MAG: ABC transporter ATP-binding protein [Pseudanabaena sp.]|nr:ABC transporter ATP-binding protein [Pseudanabaena sp. M53BS1SP1A06MG]MCA6583738.1 ABC transporter ATP-binding protein [Pseudanabaena sp. M34BS1SP1A06MG]MCA6586980.1 ABC transporter ATP-binding protein [Pseudanabaena sp. M051S1SP1A06QC]MCA6594339.1 ABC transporter ATP-binding protein [Pseudanabaena sp. M38BS1SP1A06MG]MCA6602252.1 ABC transporter ATP-binding protein [Pseudanabaena sp. M57BS1SP1A06MG]MCA6604308.1 ABC transporter ATP-binding protein [Pseudanabaena sp. M007S1SP1A06QC]MCA661624
MLEVRKICKSYGKKRVLQDLSFAIQSGEVYGLLGPNGAGKTTTISILCGLIKADRGSVMMNGQTASGAMQSLIGIAPQENIFYKSLTCEENLRFFGQLYGLNNELCRKQAKYCLELVGLGDRAKSIADTLSGGMQRRLSMAIALVHQPQLVVLDEPTTGLDIEARYEIWEVIRNLSSQETAILLTTHLLDEAERLCQRIGIIKQGSLLAEGSLEELRKYVPAKEIVLVCTPDEDLAIARAIELGFEYRHYGRELSFWLPKALELKEILEYFDGIAIDSIMRQPVRLENIYVEVTRSLEII